MSGLEFVCPCPPPANRLYPTGVPPSTTAWNPRRWVSKSVQLSSGSEKAVLNFRGRYTAPYTGSASSTGTAAGSSSFSPLSHSS